MKYTHYLLSKQFINISQLETNKPYLKIIMIPVGASVSIMGFTLILGLLPSAFITDKSRDVIAYITKKVKR